MLKDRWILYWHRKKWRRLNAHNLSTASNVFNINCVKVGKHTYGSIAAYTYDISTKLSIGSFCSIGPSVSFIVSADHHLDHISSYPFKVKILGEEFEGVSKGNIVVDDDVWIGCGAIILSGVHIGRGAVIAAGAVVTNDVEPYTIVGGIPAKAIRKRFPDTLVEELMKVDYDKLSKEMIQANIDKLYTTLNECEQLEWMPKLSLK